MRHSKNQRNYFLTPGGVQFSIATNKYLRWTDKFLRLGIDGYKRDIRQRLAMVNMSGYLTAFASCIFIITYAFEDHKALKWLIVGNIVATLIFVTISFWHRFNSVIGAGVFATTLGLSLLYYTYELGRDSGLHLFFIGAIAFIFIIYWLKYPKIILVTVLSYISAHLICHFYFKTGRVQPNLDPDFVDQIYIMSATMTMIILAVIAGYAFKLARDAELRAHLLLKNMLPSSVSERLLAEPDGSIADQFPEAGVLFADIVGFTQMSDKLGAEEVVKLLNELFSKFDAHCLERSVEKIKTIGDAYMVVSGIPKPQDDHAERLIEIAILMNETTRAIAQERDLDIDIRIGIAIGPITAGVLGKTKFVYDVWSSTVNLASRLESICKPGSVRVCDNTCEKLKENYQFKSTKQANLKGLGDVKSWYLEEKITA